MSNNYIEEFFISIGFDTKKVKKESAEIDKMLDGLVKKKRNAVSEEVKLKNKLHKLNKSAETDNFKSFLGMEAKKRQAIKKTEEARRKQAVGLLTAGSGNRITSKTSMFSPVKETKDVEAIKNEAQRKRYIKRKKHRAELAKSRKKEEQVSLNNAHKALQQRLREFKAQKASLVPEGRVRAQGMVTRFRESSSFTGLGKAQHRGLIDPSFNAMLDKAAMDGNIREVHRLKRALMGATKALNTQARASKRLGTIQKGLTDSTRNMIRSYASVFALFQATVSIKRVGQDFQGMQASMLAASGSAPAAAKDIAFIDNIVGEMGLNLKDTTDAFVKFKFAAKGKIAQTDIEALFKNVSMFGTALKVAPEDMKRAQRALSQMMSKNLVMSEELKMQLGDALPGAVQVFAKALNMSEAELFKQMEQGKLIASEVLPKVAQEYKNAAVAGGAYNLALKGLRVTEGQLVTDSQRAAKTMFEGGFSEGLADLYKTIADILKNSTPQLKKLGAAFGLAFSSIARILDIVAPILRVVIDYFEWIFGAIMLYKIGVFITGMNTLRKSFIGASLAARGFGASVASSMAVALAPLVAVMAAFITFDEWLASRDPERVNIKEARQGYQIINGRKVGVEKRDGKYYSTGDMGAVDYRSATMQRSGSLASQVRGMDYSNKTNTNTNATIKMDVSIKDVPDRKIAEHVTTEIERSFSQIFNGGLVPQTR